MAGIIAQSVSSTMDAGDTVTDGTRTGFLTGEQIALTVTPAGATYQWALTKPQGATSKADLAADEGAATSFTPDVAGFWLATCLVDGATSYTMRVSVTQVAQATAVQAMRLSPMADDAVVAPPIGSTLYYSTDIGDIARKDANGDVSTLQGAQGPQGPAGIVLGNVVSVLTYGADPTGATNSTTAFNNAATAAGASGTVVIPRGTYKLTAPFALWTRRWIGEYYDSTSYTKLVADNAYGGAFLWTVGKSRLQDVVIDCDNKAANGFAGSGSDFEVLNVAAVNATADSFLFAEAQSCYVENIYSAASPAAGFRITGANGSRFRNLKSTGDRYGVFVGGKFWDASMSGGECLIDGVLVQSSTDTAMWIRGAQCVLIRRAIVEFTGATAPTLKLTDTALACKVEGVQTTGASGGTHRAIHCDGARMCEVDNFFVATPSGGDTTYRAIKNLNDPASSNNFRRCFRLSHTVVEALPVETS